MMAMEYFVYSDLDKTELTQRLNIAAGSVRNLWVAWRAHEDLGPFHEEVMQDYGVSTGFKSSVYCRHDKEHSVEARQAMLTFFESIPGRKLLLNGDVFVAFIPN